MTLKQYQEINLIPTGTTYEFELAKYFNIDTNEGIEDVRRKLKKELEIKEYKLGETFTFNGKAWYIEKELMDATFEQWTTLELLVAEGDNLKNLHKILAIYCRPMEQGKFLRRKRISKFRLDKHEELAQELLHLPIDITQTLVLFFYQSVIQSLNYIKIAFLNQMNQKVNQVLNSNINQK